MTKTCILLNGPTLCGKGVAVKHLMSELEGVNISCKDHLHELVIKMFNVPVYEYFDIYNDRDLKEVPNAYFAVNFVGREYDYFKSKILDFNMFVPERHYNKVTGQVWLSIREALIYVSECICKPRFGGDYFGKVRAQKVVASGANLFYDDSLGFVSELPPLIDAVGQKNILAIRIHREGFTFAGDSRSYIPDGVIANTIDITNEEGKEGEYLDKIFHAVEQFHYKRRVIK